MSSDDLYEDAIVRLAKSGHGAGKLEGASRAATIDNPLCGDRVTVELDLADGQVRRLGHTVKGCILCKASAAMLGLHAGELTREALAANAAALDAMLKEGVPPPPSAWPELKDFAPVGKHRSRFDCVRLPLQAAAKALEGTS